MKVLAVTDTDQLAGAGIAARRIHRALSGAGMDASMAVMQRRSSDGDVACLGGASGRAAFRLRRLAANGIFRAAGASAREVLSANMFPSGVHRIINAHCADVVHLHWIGGEFLRIEELPLVRGPIVWTLHDEWSNLGIEHYSSLQPRQALLEHLDRWTRRRKRRSWAAAGLTMVAPSRWLADRTEKAGIVGGDHIRVIPNPVPVSIFRPMDRREAKARLNIPQDLKVVGFGAIRGVEDPRKGFALLQAAVAALALQRSDLMLLVFGAQAGPAMALPTRYAGIVEDEEALARLYASMDAFVCASRQENLPNTIAEAMACGVACAAFNTGGIPDLVQHQRSGYLATPYEPDDLARGILDCLDEPRNAAYGRAGRAFAEETLAPSRVAALYVEAYLHAMRSPAGTAHSGERTCP